MTRLCVIKKALDKLTFILLISVYIKNIQPAVKQVKPLSAGFRR